VLLPYLYVAIPGLINLLELDFSLPYLGFVLYLLPILFFLKYYKLIKKLIKGSLRINFILWITLVVTYFSSYSLSTISWITHFPLWNGNSPNLLWGRWNAIVYYTILLVFVSLNISPKYKFSILGLVIFQNLTLQVFGFNYLKRWW